VRRAALLAAASLAAILIQLTWLNRLPLPGGAAPDLVLVLVVAVALTGGPMDGMLTGFFAGLALDVAPPASHLVGQYALVFCVAGYAAGRLSGALSGTNWLPLGAVALCAAGGEALYAAVGMLFGDPGVTWSAVRHVLPVSVGYDLLVCPFVLRATVAARAWTTPGWAADGFLAGRSALAGPSGTPERGAAPG
jgi:rod shape-determining protein MreD